MNLQCIICCSSQVSPLRHQLKRCRSPICNESLMSLDAIDHHLTSVTASSDMSLPVWDRKRRMYILGCDFYGQTRSYPLNHIMVCCDLNFNSYREECAVFCLYLPPGVPLQPLPPRISLYTGIYIWELNHPSTRFHCKHLPLNKPESLLRLIMLTSESSFSAFIPTSNSSQNIPPLGDDEELWEMFLKLVLEHRAKLAENLADTLNTSLLFVSSSPFINIHSSPIL